MSLPPDSHVTVSSRAIHGVFLIPSWSPQFDLELGSDSPRLWDDAGVRRYSVMVRNLSGQQVLAFNLLWTTTRADGSVHVGGWNVFNFSSAGSGIAAGESRLMSILGPTVVYAGKDSTLSPFTAGQIAKFDREGPVHFSLDAVLLADGNAYGPDTRHAIEQWRAWATAQDDVYRRATSVPEGETAAALAEFLPAALRIWRQSQHAPESAVPKDGAVFGAMADHDHSGNYPRLLALAEGYLADSLITEIRRGGTRGEQICRKRLSYILEHYPVPQIHRVEEGNQ